MSCNEQIVECVPNFSEGRDMRVVDGIVSAIASAQAGGRKVQVLNVDPGAAANRTVVTFAGSSEAVAEAAFRGVEAAGQLIDMSVHHGTHPRIGATDVLPIVPVSGITLEECAAIARKLAERIFTELGIPCYCYEASAFRPERTNLAVCRAGEYESLPDKIADPERRPDFSPDSFDAVTKKSGASVVGARNFLVAVNFNLDTDSAPEAHEIACDVRQKGRKGPDGKWIPGPLKGCKAIGWYIEEYGIAQVSMNITDIDATPLHIAYETVKKSAQKRGRRVTGTEIIGLVPKRVLIEAGRFYLGKDASDAELYEAAINNMGLDDLRPFKPEEKVIELLLKH